jgi:hypothetical protein
MGAVPIQLRSDELLRSFDRETLYAVRSAEIAHGPETHVDGHKWKRPT